MQVQPMSTPPNMRLKVAGTDCRPLPLRRRARRPQFKHDPLGGAVPIVQWSILRMLDRATPNLPSRDLVATSQFYARLGFTEAFRDEGWLIVERGPIQIEFFPFSKLDPRKNIASCCIRVSDLNLLHQAFIGAGRRLRAATYLGSLRRSISPGGSENSRSSILTAICCAASRHSPHGN